MKIKHFLLPLILLLLLILVLMDIPRDNQLHEAAANGHFETVKTLMVKGADVNAKDTDNFTPLHYAVRNGHAKIVTALIAGDADINVKAPDGATPLREAAYNGHAEIATALIAKGADVNARKTNGATPLHSATHNGHAEIVTALIARGADVNAKATNGITPLHNSVIDGHTEIAIALIAGGADVNAKTTNGTAPLHAAAIKGHAETVTALIAGGADVNAKTTNGTAPLHAAAIEGHAETVTALIAGGADVNAKTTNGTAPLHAAAIEGRTETVTALIAGGADVNAKNTDGLTPLHLAAPDGHAETVTALIAGRADINAKADKDFTPLYFAALKGRTEVVTALIAGGADVNAKTTNGTASLHGAAENGHAETVTALIAGGAGVNEKDSNGETPLNLAKKSGNTETTKILTTAKNEAWAISSSKDEMTGEMSFYASSPISYPTKALSSPYKDIHSRIIVGCNSYYDWAHIEFNHSIIITNYEATPDYRWAYYTAKTKWNKHIDHTNLRFDFKNKRLLYFFNHKRIISNIMKSDTMLLELDWHDNEKVYFPYSLKYSSNAIDEVYKKCGIEKPQKIASDNTEDSDKYGEWDVFIDTDPEFETRIAALILEPENTLAKLVARCENDKMELYIDWNGPFPGPLKSWGEPVLTDTDRPYVYVTTKLGDGESRTELWTISDTEDSTFHPRPKAFIVDMIYSVKLTANLTNREYPAHVFNTKGLANAVKPLQKACKW